MGQLYSKYAIYIVCSFQQHKMETTELMNGLKETNMRVREERKRQLEMLRAKREQKLQLKDGGKSSRQAPPPAAASKETKRK